MTALVESHPNTVIAGMNNLSTTPTLNIDIVLSHNILHVTDSHTVSWGEPLFNALLPRFCSATKCLLSTRLVLIGFLGSSFKSIIGETSPVLGVILGMHSRGPIVAFLHRDVAPCRSVVGFELELDPGGGKLGAALNSAFEGRRQLDEDCLAVCYGDGLIGRPVIGVSPSVAVFLVVIKAEFNVIDIHYESFNEYSLHYIVEGFSYCV